MRTIDFAPETLAILDKIESDYRDRTRRIAAERVQAERLLLDLEAAVPGADRLDPGAAASRWVRATQGKRLRVRDARRGLAAAIERARRVARLSGR